MLIAMQQCALWPRHSVSAHRLLPPFLVRLRLLFWLTGALYAVKNSPQGLEYYVHYDYLVATLADGSFHVFTGVSTRPVATTSSPSDDQSSQVEMTTHGLSRAVRDVFVAIESLNGRVSQKDVMNLGSAVAFGGLGGWIWLHE